MLNFPMGIQGPHPQVCVALRAAKLLVEPLPVGVPPPPPSSRDHMPPQSGPQALSKADKPCSPYWTHWYGGSDGLTAPSVHQKHSGGVLTDLTWWAHFQHRSMLLIATRSAQNPPLQLCQVPLTPWSFSPWWPGIRGLHLQPRWILWEI